MSGPFHWTAEDDPMRYEDHLTFLGWSADDTHYAFEVSSAPQGAECSGFHELFVVDATADVWAEGGHVRVAHDRPEAGPDGCSPPTLDGRVEQARAELVARHRIVVGRGARPTFVGVGADGSPELTLPDGRTLRLALTGDPPRVEDPYGPVAARGAAYRLVAQLERWSLVVEDGTRRRAHVIGYTLNGSPAFPAPGGKRLALMVQTEHAAFEGTRASVMSNAITLPPP